MEVKYWRSRIAVTLYPPAASSCRHTSWVCWSGTRKAMWCTVPPATRPGSPDGSATISTTVPGSPSCVDRRYRPPDSPSSLMPRSWVRVSSVGSGSVTVSTEECCPRTAYCAGTEAESHGLRGSVSDEATRSICRPSGSRSDSRSSSDEARDTVDATPMPLKCSCHQPRVPEGTENAVVVDWPLPTRPLRTPCHGKKVSSEPGVPASSP